MAAGDLLRQTKFLNYIEISDTGKTKVIGVGNNQGQKLAYLKWAAGWRRYVFMPFKDTQFDADCLKDILDFMEKLMADRKNG